jgi:4-hydroxythreonine-4-phosphate dehydrogenase
VNGTGRETPRSSGAVSGPNLPRIALSSGEPAGVGPDLCLAVAVQQMQCELVCLGDRQLLAERAKLLNLPVTLRDYDPANRTQHTPGTLTVSHHALATPSLPGKLDSSNSRYVLALIDRAVDDAVAGEFDAIVTAPVHKGVINDAGIPFTGHTEYLAERTRAPLPVMMLATSELRVALATTHLPLKDVSAAITIDSLCQTLEILDRDLRNWWGLEAPRIAVCGLNPHAGEGGYLGDEEIRVITPAVARMRERGLNVTGPLPADTAFVPAKLAECDAVLAMYHDQGLPVIKHSGFERAVNVTLGLPIVRTSVDHGTALDLAGTGRADPRSLRAAIDLAIALARASCPRG